MVTQPRNKGDPMPVYNPTNKPRFKAGVLVGLTIGLITGGYVGNGIGEFVKERQVRNQLVAEALQAKAAYYDPETGMLKFGSLGGSWVKVERIDTLKKAANEK
jgi:hypothetical protein